MRNEPHRTQPGPLSLASTLRDQAESCIASLTARELPRLLWEGVPLFDARSARDRGRQPCLMAVPLSHQAPRQQLLQHCSDPSLPIICCSNRERRARRLALRFRRLGCRHVVVLRGGLEALSAQALAG